MKKIIILITLLLAIGLTTTHAQNTWAQKSNLGGTARYGAVGFSIGAKGYIGTGYDGSYKNDFWEYDPSTNAWTQKANFGGTARQYAVGFSILDKGYVGTGYDGSNKNDFWQYDPTANTWAQKTNFGGIPRQNAVGFSLNDKGYLGTGYDGVNKKDFWEYNPDTNTWTQKADFGGTARKSAAAFSIGSKGYIGTGNDGAFGTPNKTDFWEYDPILNTWTQKSSFGGTGRSSAVGFSIGDKGFIGTGKDGNFSSPQKNDFWQYDPATNSWTQKAVFGGTARYAAAGFAIANNGFLGCGIDGTAKNDFWEYTPDCNGITVYADADGDNYGDSTNSYFALDCVPPTGYVLFGNDCNDNNATIHPGACDGSNGVDDNCDGIIDDGSGATLYFSDGDGDTYGAGTGSFICSDPGSGYSLYNTDCKDDNPAIHPGACDGSNGVDDNCNGVMDDGTGASTYYTDADVDGYGAGTGSFECGNPGAGYSTNNSDCADEDATINPGISEIINGIDDNCNGDIDESNIWTQKSDFSYNAANVPEPASRFGAVGFSIGSKGYIGTGYATDGFKKDFWEYDPTLNTWTQKADFEGSARRHAVAFSIGNAGYIGTGYDNNNTYKNDFWKYDPNENIWVQIADFGGSGREEATGFSISNKGYVGTGYNNGSKNDFWEYDSYTNTWTQKADFGGNARYSASGFSFNSKGYIGTGVDNTYTFKKDFWEYDPGADKWTQKVDFGGTARRSAASFSLSSGGYLGTGYDTGYGNRKDFWKYDPVSNTWIQKEDFNGNALYYAVGFSINDRGYLGTGTNCCSYYKDFCEYDPALNTWTKKADFGGNSSSGAVGFSIGSKGYIGTGFNSGVNSKSFWEYDPANNSWTQKADFEGSARSGAVGFSIGNKGYIGTGYNWPYYLKDFWEYNPVANSWKQKADFGGAARSGAVGFGIGNKGYIGTGGAGSYSDQLYNDFWEYDQSSNIWKQKANFGGNVRSGGVGISIAGKGYVGTGVFREVRYNWWSSVYYYHYNNNFWEYDPVTDTWKLKAKFGGAARYGAVGFSVGNKGYIGTGYGDDGEYKDFWEYDEPSNTWKQQSDFGGFARSGATGFSIDNKGYIGTGYDNLNTYYKDFWEYLPNVEETGCDIPIELTTVSITSTKATLKWEAVSGAIGYQVLYKPIGTSQWSLLNSSGNENTLTELTPNTEYAWEVKSICSLSPLIQSENSHPSQFITNPLRLSVHTAYQLIFDIYPNPVSQSASVYFSLNEASPVAIEIMDVNGRSLRVIAKNDFSAGSHEVTINSESMVAGIYFLQLKTNEGVMMKKMVIE